MNKEIQKSKYIFKHNLLFTFIACIINLLAFKFLPDAKHHFIEYGILINGFLLYVYYNQLFSKMRKMIVGIKKEITTSNIPLRILFFFLLLIGILIWNTTTIYKLNPEAVNILFVSNVFIKTVTTHLPFILMLIFMFIITPAIIVPNYDNTKYKKANNILLLLLFFLISFMTIEIYINSSNEKLYIDFSKYELGRITYSFNQKYLEYEDITEEAKAIIEKNQAIIPFSYTKKEKMAFSYEEAEEFCKSMNAEVASLSEIYNITFNKFETHGDTLYWTRDTAGRTPVVMHYKDMNYIAKKADKRTKANVVCTTKQNEKYLYTKKPIEAQNINLSHKETNINPIETNIEQKEIDTETMNIPTEFLGFDIIFANEQYINKMIANGYKYNKTIKINPLNQVDEFSNIKRIQQIENKVKFCHFPFMDFINFTMEQEKEVWKQNFCIPSFEIINVPQVEKTQYEKDAYCQSHGGRVPNISELSGIIKASNYINLGQKYWANNPVTKNGTKKHIYLSNLNKEIYNVQIAETNETAQVICIKDGKEKTNIIANFTSKFENASGSYFAKEKCPKCDYYEMPDMVLNQ